MVKLSQQISKQRLTRTDRVRFQEEQVRYSEEQSSLQQAKQKLESAKTVDEYESIYNSLSSNQKSYFKSPSQVKQENPSQPQPSTQQFVRLGRLGEVPVEKYEQARDLIFRGKAGIGGQDPKLKPIINYLVEHGVESAEQMEIRRNPYSETITPLPQQILETKLIFKPSKIPAPSYDNLYPTRNFLESDTGQGLKVAFGKINDAVDSYFLKPANLNTGNKPTTISEQELKSRKGEIQTGLVLAGLRLFQFSKSPNIQEFPELIRDTQGYPNALRKGYLLKRDIRKGQEEAKEYQQEASELSPTALLQIEGINVAGGELSNLNTEVQSINQRIASPNISPEEQQRLLNRFEQIQIERENILSGLKEKGINQKSVVTEQGESITFSSPEIERINEIAGIDLAPAQYKELRGLTKGQKITTIGTALGIEATEFAVIGFATGQSGAITKIGTSIAKLPKIAKATLFIGEAGLLTAGIGYSGYSGYQSGKNQGNENLGVEGAFLGAGIPLARIGGFTTGAYFGSKLYTQRIVEKAERGGFTKPRKVLIDRNGNIILDENGNPVYTDKGRGIPQQLRKGATLKDLSGEQIQTRVQQGDVLRTRIPETDITIDTKAVTKGLYIKDKGYSESKIISEISGKDARALSGTTSKSRGYIVSRDGKEGIVTFTKTPKGVTVRQYSSTVDLKRLIELAQTDDGSKTFFIDFNRQVTQLGQPEFVKGATLSNKDLLGLQRQLDVNRLFTSFKGEDKLISLGRTQQIIKLKPEQDYFGVDNLKIGTIKEFGSVGSSRYGSVDSIKRILALQEKIQGFNIFPAGKGGQLTLLQQRPVQEFVSPTPATFVVKPTTISPLPSTNVANLQLIDIIKSLEPSISSTVALKTLIGSGQVAGVLAIPTQQFKQINALKSDQVLLQKLLQQQRQEPVQQQQQRQSQGFRQNQLLNQINQILEEPPILPPSPPPRFSPAPAGFGLFGIDNLILKQLKEKRKKGKQVRTYAYVPDFTSRILGIEESFNEKDIDKLTKKAMTGFELRPRVRIR